MLASPTEPMAIRTRALSAAMRLTIPYQELAAEVFATTEQALSTSSSAALHGRAARELPKLRAMLQEVLPS